jgi:hypothetical protein
VPCCCSDALECVLRPRTRGSVVLPGAASCEVSPTAASARESTCVAYRATRGAALVCGQHAPQNQQQQQQQQQQKRCCLLVQPRAAACNESLGTKVALDEGGGSSVATSRPFLSTYLEPVSSAAGISVSPGFPESPTVYSETHAGFSRLRK